MWKHFYNQMVQTFSHEKHETVVKPPSSCMCHICSKIFNSKSSLTKHLVSFHVDKKDYRFKCDVCEKSFPAKSKLNRHMVMHTGVRNFSCATCGNKFLTKPTLEQHERTHSGKKPFSCSSSANEINASRSSW